MFLDFRVPPPDPNTGEVGIPGIPDGADILGRVGFFFILEVAPDLEPVPDSEGRWHRLWLPHEAGGDGFFAARLRRRVDA